MKTVLPLALLGLLSSPAFAFQDYEPFADATAAGGTAYAVGTPLIGQTNATGQSWFQAGPVSATQPTIVAGNLSYAGLPDSQGNSVSFGGSGESARLNLSSIVGSGTIYYSMLVDVTGITGLSSSGVFWAGFNNSRGSQTTTPSAIATRLYTRLSGTGYQLGVAKNSSTASDWIWDSTVRNVGDTLFVVGSYEINATTTTDDVSRLWINPDASTFGGDTAPGATLTALTGADISLSQVASFVLFDRSTAQPSGMVDELRIGTSWAEVTAVPEPAAGGLLLFGLLGLAAARRAGSAHCC